MGCEGVAEQFEDGATRCKPTQMRAALRVVAQVGDRSDRQWSRADTTAQFSRSPPIDAAPSPQGQASWIRMHISLLIQDGELVGEILCPRGEQLFDQRALAGETEAGQKQRPASVSNNPRMHEDAIGSPLADTKLQLALQGGQGLVGGQRTGTTLEIVKQQVVRAHPRVGRRRCQPKGEEVLDLVAGRSHPARRQATLDRRTVGLRGEANTDANAEALQRKASRPPEAVEFLASERLMEPAGHTRGDHP